MDNSNQIKMDMLISRLAYQQIDELFQLDGVIHIGIKDRESYVVIDCYDDYCIWWNENKANPEDFITDYEFNPEDGSTSRSKVLEPSINVLNIPDFEEYIRHVTGLQILKIEDEDWHVEIDLQKLLHTITIVKLYNRHKVPQDLLISFDKVISAARKLERIN